MDLSKEFSPSGSALRCGNACAKCITNWNAQKDYQIALDRLPTNIRTLETGIKVRNTQGFEV